MSAEDLKKLSPTDPELIDRIVSNIKARGIFDQFRKDCLADVDTKPAYQNLQQRVNGTVRGYLGTRKWNPTLNKNQLRENLRKYTVEQPYLEVGVDRIVDQVVNPKMYSVFMPKIEDIVYEMLGIEKPKPKPLFPNYKNYSNNHTNRQSTPSKHLANSSPSAGRSASPISAPPPTNLEKAPEAVKVEEIKDEKVLVADPADESKSDMSYSPIAVKDEIKEEEVEEGPKAKAPEEVILEVKTPEAPETTNNEDDSNTIDEMPLLAASMDADSNQASLSALDSAQQTCNTKSEGRPEFADDRSTTPRPPTDFDTLTNNLSSLKSDEKISPSKKFDNFSNLDEKLKQADVNLRETSNKKAVDTEESSELTKSSSDRSDSESTNSKIDHSESNTSVENNRLVRIKRRILSDSSGDSNSESTNKVRPIDSEDGHSITGLIVDKHSAIRSPVTDKLTKRAEGKKDMEKSSRSADGKSKVKDDAKEKTKSHDESRHRSDKHRSHRSEKSVSHKEKNDNRDRSEHEGKDDKKHEKNKKDYSSKKHSDKTKRDDDKVKTNDAKKNDDSNKHDKGKHRSSEKSEDKHKRDKTEHKSSSKKSSSSRDDLKKKDDKPKDEDKDKEHRDKKDKKETNGDKYEKKSKDEKKSSKKKGGHCDEDDSKTKNSRRSSDRDSNGGGGSSSAPKHNSSSTNSSSSKKSSSKSDKGRSKHKSSSSKESVDDVSDGPPASKEVDEVDLFLMQITESIDEEQEACRKLKTASNFSEMMKIMEARKSCRRSTSLDADDPFQEVVNQEESTESASEYKLPDLGIEAAGKNLLWDDGVAKSSELHASDTVKNDEIQDVSIEVQKPCTRGHLSCNDGRNPANVLPNTDHLSVSVGDLTSLIGPLKPCVMVDDVMSGPMGKKLQKFGFVHMGNAQSSPDSSLSDLTLSPEVKQHDGVVPERSSTTNEGSPAAIASEKIQTLLESTPSAQLTPGSPTHIQEANPSVVANPNLNEPKGVSSLDESKDISPPAVLSRDVNSASDGNSHGDHADELTAPKVQPDVPENASDVSDAALPEAKVRLHQVTPTPRTSKKDSLLEASTSCGNSQEPEAINVPSPAPCRSRRKNAGSLMYAVLEGLNEKLVINKRGSESTSPALKKKCLRIDKLEVVKNDKTVPADADISNATFDRSDISNKENNQGHASNMMSRSDGLVNSDVKIVEPRLTRRKNQINSPADDVSRMRVSLAFKNAESRSQFDVLTESSAKLEHKSCLSSPVSITAKSTECLNEKPSVELISCPIADTSTSSVLQRRQSCPSVIQIGALECRIGDSERKPDVCTEEELGEGSVAAVDRDSTMAAHSSPVAAESSFSFAAESCSAVSVGGISAVAAESSFSVAAVSGSTVAADSSSTIAADSTSTVSEPVKPSVYEKPSQKLKSSTRRQSVSQKSDDGVEEKWTVATRKSNRFVLTRSSVRKNSCPPNTGDKKGSKNFATKRSDSESSGEISCTSESSGQNDAQPNKSTDSGYAEGPIVNSVEVSAIAEVTMSSNIESKDVTILNSSDKENKLENTDEPVQCPSTPGPSVPETVPSRNPEKTDPLEMSTSSSNAQTSSSDVPLALKFANPPEPSEFLSDSDEEFKGFSSVDEENEKVMKLFKKFHSNSCKVLAADVADKASGPVKKAPPPISPMRTRKKKCLVDRGENQSNDIERRTDAMKLTLVSRNITPGKNGIVAKRSQTPITTVTAPTNLRKRSCQTVPPNDEKRKKLRNSQSYSATDLYKPRPLIGKESSIAVGSSPANKRLKKGPR